MSIRHHADAVREYLNLDDPAVYFRDAGSTSPSDWRLTSNPCWSDALEYTVVPREYQFAMDAFIAGELEWRSSEANGWIRWFPKIIPSWGTTPENFRRKAKEFKKFTFTAANEETEEYLQKLIDEGRTTLDCYAGKPTSYDPDFPVYVAIGLHTTEEEQTK